MSPPTTRVVVIATGVVAAVAALVAALVLATRGTETASVPATTATVPGSTAAPAPPPAPAVAPLTGLPATGDSTRRSALVVKIDDVEPRSRPQAGLEQADVVYEEKIEGPNSRFAAVFQSQGAELVGPVRSGRSTDLAIVAPLNRPLYAFSGANETFLAQLRAGPLVDVGADAHPDAYRRLPGREAPDNLFSATEVLWGLAEGGGPPAPLWPFRPADAPAPSGSGVRTVTALAYDWGGGFTPIEYRWDAADGLWRRDQAGTPHVDVADRQLSTTNVIVQQVRYVDTGIRDVAGTPVPEAQLLGEGDATVFTAGVAVPARWRRADEATPTAFVGPDGAPVALTPGRTTVVLLPTDAELRVR